MSFTVVHLKVVLLSLMATTVLAVCLGPVYVLSRLRSAEAASGFVRGRAEERRRRRKRELWVSRMSVFAAGVFVSVGLMDLFPDAYGDLLEAAEVFKWRMRRFPLSYFLMLCGFFMVLVLEQIVLSWKEAQLMRRGRGPKAATDADGSERDPLLPSINSASATAVVDFSRRGPEYSSTVGSSAAYGTSVALGNPISGRPGFGGPRPRRARSLSDVGIPASWRQDDLDAMLDYNPSMVGMRADPMIPWGDPEGGNYPGAAGAGGSPRDDAAAADAEIEAAPSEDDGTASGHECEHRRERQHEETFVSASQIRTVLLVAAMSVHSLFEGLSLGLIPALDNAASLFAAILLHKLIVAFSIGMQLSSARLALPTVISCACVFALMSPVGCGLGMLVIQFVNHSVAKLVSGVLQSVTSGTFLYVAFFEVLPHEFNAGRDRLGKLLALVLGFATVCVYVFIDSMKDSAD